MTEGEPDEYSRANSDRDSQRAVFAMPSRNLERRVVLARDGFGRHSDLYGSYPVEYRRVLRRAEHRGTSMDDRTAKTKGH